MSIQEEKPYVDFYTKHGISPVSQNISDFESHLERRTSLFKDLGVPPRYFNQAKIMEVGPGSGFNSIHVAQFDPEKYTLVEPNNTGRKKINELFATHAAGFDKYEIVETFIQDLDADNDYDIVFGEGFLGMLPDAAEVVKKMGSFVVDGGILSITCSDSVSYFADVLKRVIGRALINPESSLDEQLHCVRPYYEKIVNIVGMSRPIDDWIIDNVLQPMNKNYTFAIDDAVRAVQDDFVFYNSSSPRFNDEWRWYKQQCNQGDRYNNDAVAQYKMNIHNLLDYRFNYPPIEKEDNANLLMLTEKIFQTLSKYELSQDSERLQEIIEIVFEIIKFCEEKDFSIITVQALKDFNTGLDAIIQNSVDVDFKSFANFSGRGQQFVSFLKKSSPFIR